MSLLKRRKRNNGLETFGGENVITIKPYAPHQNLSPKDYLEPKAMQELKRMFERQVMRFLDKATPDRFNRPFDDIIMKAKGQALKELEVERLEHIRCIERSISSLWKGDEVSYERKLEQYNAEYEKRNAELIKLKAIYQRDTALEEKKERSVR